MQKTDTILILAPHTDDGELGCGASIAKYIAEGKQVHYVAFSSCAASLPSQFSPDTLVKECTAATRSLGITSLRFFDFEVRKFPSFRQEILEQLVVLQRDLQPQTVFLPAAGDVHQDHQVIHAEGFRAFKKANLLGYELPWNNTRFQPNYFEPITPEQLKRKQQALDEYKSQAHRQYMQETFIRSLAIVRGLQAQVELAEAFEVYRMTGK